MSNKNKKLISTNGRLKEVFLMKLIIILWYLIPALSERIIRKMFFAPPKTKASEFELSFLKLSKPFFITVNNQKVQCWKWGNGPAVILVHGWGGYGLQLSNFINPLIEQGFSIITYDNPGHGFSDGQTSSYFEFCDTLRTLIQYVKGEEIQGIIGHSIGGAAIINCIARGEYNIKMVLIAPTINIHETLDDVFSFYQIPKKLYGKIISQFEAKYGYSLKEEEPSLLMSQIKSRGIIIHDIDDRKIPYKESKKTSEKFSNLTLHTTTGLGHKRILKDQGIIKKAIDYLK